MKFNKGHFFSALAGLVVGVMLVSVLPVSAGGIGPEEDIGVTADVGPRATYSGCLVGGQLRKVLTKDRKPERCDGMTSAGGQPARYVTWNARGPAGPAGLQGSPGIDGISGYERVSESVVLGDVGSGADQFLTCPAGKVALGGWHFSVAGVKRIDVFRSAPMGDDVWWFTYEVLAGAGEGVTFYVICAAA